MERRPMQLRRRPEHNLAWQQTPIGFFGHEPGTSRNFCFGDGCAVAGSAEQLRTLVQRSGRATYQEALLRSTTYDEIRAGLAFGGAYVLDSTALARFLPLARQEGLDLVIRRRVLEPRRGCAPLAPLGCPESRLLLHHVSARRVALDGSLQRLLERLPRVDVPAHTARTA